MAASRFLWALPVAALLVVSDATPPPSMPQYTDAEKSTYVTARLARPPKCTLQLDKFEVCDDDCLRVAQALVAAAPNCTYAYQDATASLNACEDWRAGKATTYKYMPLNGTGLAVCNITQTGDFIRSYGSGSPTFDCVGQSYVAAACTNECLALIEERVTKSPACTREPTDHWCGEHQKEFLLRCLTSRSDSPASNAVMYSVRNGDGSLTRVSPPSTAPVTAAPAEGNNATTTTTNNNNAASAPASAATTAASLAAVARSW